MAKEPDKTIHALLREISAKQDHQSKQLAEQSAKLDDHSQRFAAQSVKLDDHSGQLGVLEAVAVQVAGMSADIHGMKGDIVGMKGDIRSIKGELEVIHSDAHDTRVEMHKMGNDIRELRADTNEVRRVVAGHSLRFDFLDERVEVLRKGTLTAISAASGATESNKQLKEQIAGLTKRVEKLEKAK